MTMTINKTEKDFWIEMSIREISTQSHFAKIAFSHIDPKAKKDNDAVFSSIHSFLSHCAMVSKMLAAKDDGKPPKSIGDILSIESISLIHQKRFRNHLEHYDERLKKWIRKYGINKKIGTYNIGPKSRFQSRVTAFISHYDHYSETFTFIDEDFELKALFQEVRSIKGIADKWVKDMEIGKISPPFG